MGQLRLEYSGGSSPETAAVGALLGKCQGAVVTWSLQRGAARAGEEEEERRNVWEVSLMSVSQGPGSPAQLPLPWEV